MSPLVDCGEGVDGCAVSDCCPGHTVSCREGTHTLNSIAGA